MTTRRSSTSARPSRQGRQAPVERSRLTEHVAAAGCAAKLGPADLANILRQLPRDDHPDVIVGTDTSDDAGVFRLRPDLAIVNTVDFFTPIVDDPDVFGQIAAANALSDVYAMGADPVTALNIVGFPRGRLDIEILGEILNGGAERARAAGAVVIGGHTIIDDELKYGMAITGVVHPDRVLRNVGVRDGDVLVLTKPLGTGIVTTALKRRKASAASVRAAIASMVALNQAASHIARRFPVHACSDVTGFGLLGHSTEMAMGSGVTLMLDSAKLPLLPGARRLGEAGLLTGGCRRNRAYLEDKVVVNRAVSVGMTELAFDPQTSGGLLIALPAKAAGRLLTKLHARGIEAAAIVGRACARRDAWVYLD
jgi:selenide,water dikinase